MTEKPIYLCLLISAHVIVNLPRGDTATTSSLSSAFDTCSTNTITPQTLVKPQLPAVNCNALLGTTMQLIKRAEYAF